MKEEKFIVEITLCSVREFIHEDGFGFSYFPLESDVLKANNLDELRSLKDDIIEKVIEFLKKRKEVYEKGIRNQEPYSPLSPYDFVIRVEVKSSELDKIMKKRLEASFEP